MTNGSEPGLFERWVGDGRPLLAASAGALIFAGGFAIFLALTGDFLPHDVDFLGMTADELCEIECRIVDFMVHDRASFGGALVGIGILYMWLVTFPLADGESWAWWTLAITGSLGFLSFLSYVGYGYLDTWHGWGTALLLPVFALGLVRTRRLVTGTISMRDHVRGLGADPRDRVTAGRVLLAVGAAGTFGAGLVILGIGVSHVFVPQDIHFIGMSSVRIDDISPQLVPLIAHDRAGFAGATSVVGLTTFFCLLFKRPGRSLTQAIGLAGVISLGATFAVHFAVGYRDLLHLVPPIMGAVILMVGIALIYPTLTDD